MVDTIIKCFVTIFWQIYLTVKKRPKITCDIRYSCQAQWYPDFWAPEGELLEGISIKVIVPFLIANNGPVDTTIKNIYVSLKYDEDKSVSLFAQDSDIYKDKEQPTQIMPRSIWGVTKLEFSLFLANVHELPANIEAELVIEPVAHRPVRRKINLHFN